MREVPPAPMCYFFYFFFFVDLSSSFLIAFSAKDEMPSRADVITQDSSWGSNLRVRRI